MIDPTSQKIRRVNSIVNTAVVLVVGANTTR
jgi:hypothetical protein